jgi:hypothetical protein
MFMDDGYFGEEGQLGRDRSDGRRPAELPEFFFFFYLDWTCRFAGFFLDCGKRKIEWNGSEGKKIR